MPPAVPTLRRVPFSETEQLIQTIALDGGVIVTNFTDLETLHKVNAEIGPWLEKDKLGQKRVSHDETRRCPRLIGRSATAREHWLKSPLLMAVVNDILCKTTKSFYDNVPQITTTYPYLSLSLTMDILPGAKGQPLHRDDRAWHVDHQDQTKSGYKRGSDVSMAVLCPGLPTTAANGATLIIPGSHLWDDDRAPTREEVTHATMQPGEALMFLGSTYHAGGSNTTADQTRPVHSMFFCRGTHRQEENQYLAYTADEVLSWSEQEQMLMGYAVSSPSLGYVDFVTPAQFFKGYGALLE